MEERVRIDKWLWYARFYKTRPLAQKAADSGVLRLNGQRVRKAGTFIKAGDVLTVPRGREPVAVRIVGLGTRRGPAVEAQTLYETLSETGLDREAPGP